MELIVGEVSEYPDDCSAQYLGKCCHNMDLDYKNRRHTRNYSDWDVLFTLQEIPFSFRPTFCTRMNDAQHEISILLWREHTRPRRYALTLRYLSA